jgi:hypothetical protein
VAVWSIFSRFGILNNEKSGNPGTDVTILKIFSPKKNCEKGVFDLNKAKLCKFFIITLVFEKNANFFAENWQKSQKIVIITSTPGTDGNKNSPFVQISTATNRRR